MLKKRPQDYLERLKKTLDELAIEKFDQLIAKIYSLIGLPRTIFLAGNGGSAATASHLACDLAKTILGPDPRNQFSRLRVICLNDSVPILTAWANDEGYEHVFSQQLLNLGKKGDLLIVITGSGNSANIVEAIKTAKRLGMETYGLLGFDGGRVRGLLDDYLLVPSNDYGVIEDIHMVTAHLITDCLKIQP